MIRIEDSGYKKNNCVINKRITGNANLYSKLSFEGKVPQIPTTSLRDAVEYVLPKSTKVLKYLGSNGGEIQNITINAIGTGLVAPIFIKYNFLSKADEDTRTYSAWRQPISAGLAIITQAGLTAPFYRIFDNWANNGTFGEALNRTPFQDDFYLHKLAKKKYYNTPKKNIWDIVKNIQEQQRENLLRTLEEQNTVIYTRKDGSKLKMKEETLKNAMLETVNKLAKSDNTSLNEIKKTIEKRNERGKYYSKQYSEASTFLNEIYTNIENATTHNDIKAYFSKKMRELKSSNAPNEKISIIDEVRQRAKVVSNGREAISFSDIQQALLEKVKKMQLHAKEYSVLKSDTEVENYVEKLAYKEKSKLEAATEFYDLLKTQISEQSSVREIRKQIDAKCKELDIKNSGLNKNFTEELANQIMSRAKTNMKWYKQFVGIFVSLSILPVTCTLLNWIYPRFMDSFFPNLSSKKHDKESAKLIDAAPKINSATMVQPLRAAGVAFGDNNYINLFNRMKAEVHNG